MAGKYGKQAHDQKSELDQFSPLSKERRPITMPRSPNNYTGGTNKQDTTESYTRALAEHIYQEIE